MEFDKIHTWAQSGGPDLQFSIDMDGTIRIAEGWITLDGKFQESVDSYFFLDKSAMSELICFFEYHTEQDATP